MFFFLIIIAMILGLWLPYLDVFNGVTISLLFIIYVFYQRKNIKRFYLIFFVFLLMHFIAIIRIPINTSDNVFTGMVVDVHDNYYLINTGLYKFYVYSKNNTMEIGDIVRITGSLSELNFPTYESSFDFNRFLKLKGVYYSLKTSNVENLYSTFFRINNFRRFLIERLSEDIKPFVKQIIYSNYEEDTRYMLNNIKLPYLFSTSGIHISFIINSFNKIFKRIIKPKIIYITNIVFLFLLLLILPFKISILRIIVNNFVRLFNINNKKSDPLKNWCISCLTLIVIDYHFVYQSGFLLGYLYSFIFLVINRTFKYKKKFQLILIQYLTMCVTSLLVSIVNYSDVNLVVILFLPLITTRISVLYTLTLCGYVFNCSSLLSIIQKNYDKIVGFLNCNSLNIVSGKHSIAFYLTIILAIIFIFYYLYKNVKKAVTVLSLGLTFFISLSFIPIMNYVSSSISFINVGQGDAILIRHHNKAIMVDVGGNQKIDLSSNCLIPYLKKEHLNKIDYLFITHNDKDHAGSLETLTTYFDVRNIIYSLDDKIDIDGLVFRNLNNNPSSNYDENNRSLVLYFTFINKDWLLMGDAEKSVEKDIIEVYPELHIDYLKIGHHGSKNGTSEDFIKKYTPSEAIISVGKNNSYGHPHDQVLSVLTKYNVKIRRTDLEGTIKYVKMFK